MASVETINLIRTKITSSPQLEQATVLLRKLSLWALVLLTVSGVLVSSIFFYLRIREEQMIQTRSRLSESIAGSNIKEGLLYAVKQQTALTNKIFKIQHPMGKQFNTLAAVVSVGQMTGVSYNDLNKVLLTVRTQSIAEVVTITDSLIKQAAAQSVQDVQLISFSLGTTGDVTMTVSFVPVF